MANRTLVAVALLLASAAASAQRFECAPLSPSSSRTPAYAVFADPPRCEGFFERKVSQPFLELVSLTRGPMPAGTALQLRADSKSAARLLVQPQRSGPFYRVDAALPAGQTLAWDAATMLAATGLRLVDLGFMAVVQAAATNGSPALLAPVLLSGAAAADHGISTAVVRVSVAVSSVAWRSYRLGTDGGPASDWTVLPASQLFAWQRIAVAIPLPTDGGGLQIDVQAVGADDGQALPLLRFAIDGAGDAHP
jgi:hypothetical protein